MQEAAFVKGRRAGERDTLNDIIDTYTPYLSAVVWKTMGPAASHEDVEELVADAFLALWQHRKDLDPSRGLRAYLAATAKNKAIDRLRTAKPEPLPLSDVDVSPVPGPEAALEQKLFAARLLTAVEALPSPDRELVIGYYYAREKLKNLAQALGLTETAAKTRLFRARAALKDGLTEGGAVHGTHE